MHCSTSLVREIHNCFSSLWLELLMICDLMSEAASYQERLSVDGKRLKAKTAHCFRNCNETAMGQFFRSQSLNSNAAITLKGCIGLNSGTQCLAIVLKRTHWLLTVS